VTGAGRDAAARRLRVHVGAAPLPALLRPAIERRLSGRPAPGPEGAVAEAVAAAVAGRRPGAGDGEARWR